MPAPPEKSRPDRSGKQEAGWGGTVRLAVFLAVVGCILNYAWEVGQMLAMVVPTPQAQPLWRACIPATIFDACVVFLLYLGGIPLFGDRRWILRPGPGGTAYLVMSGTVLGVAIELYGVKWTGRWGYTGAMPLLPWFEVGALPVLQMAFLPLASALVTREIFQRTVPQGTRPGRPE